MTTSPEIIEQKVDAFVANMDRLDAMTNGGVGDDVQLANGQTVPSIAKLVATTSLQVLALASYADLAAITTKPAQTGAEVVGDGGTHTENGTPGVSNSGRFTFVAGSPGYWKRIGDANPYGGLIATNIAGPITPDATGTAFQNPAIYFWPAGIRSYDQFLSKLEIGVSTAGTFKVFVAKVEANGNLSPYYSEIVYAPLGAAVLNNLGIFVPAGYVVGVQCNGGGGYYTAASNPGGELSWLIADGNLANNTAKTTGASNGVHWRGTLTGEMLFKSRKAYEQAIASAAAIGVTLDVGFPAPIVATGAAVPANYSVVYKTAAPGDGVVTEARIGAYTGGLATIIVVSVAANVATIVQQKSVTLDAGVNVVPLELPIAAGQYVGIVGGNYAFQANAGQGREVWAKASALANGDNLTPLNNSQHRYEVAFTVKTGLIGQLAGGDAGPSTEAYGFPDPIVATGSDPTSTYTIVLKNSPTEAGYITGVKVGTSVGGAATAFICTVNPGTLVLDVLTAVSINLIAGVNDIPLNLPIAPGQLVGISGGTFKYQANSNPAGVPAYANSNSAADGLVMLDQAAHRFEVQFEYSTSAGGASNGFVDTGLDLLGTADNSGTADVTSAFQSARSANPFPFVRPGKYNLASVSAGGSGLYGPGVPSVGGEHFFIPASPQHWNMRNRLRARLLEHIAARNVFTLIADSIGHFAYAPSGSEHWFNQICRFVNLGISKDEPVMTALRPSSSYTPAFYGVTTSGTVSTGTNGPLGESLILAAGASMSFTGTYAFVDVFYRQEAGAGTLSFTFNGGAAYKTVNANGATENDKFSGASPNASATGQTTSGTYTITNTGGGPVEITGLLRLGVIAADSGVSEGRLLCNRSAHGSWTFGNFGPGQQAALVKQAQWAGGKILPIIALGINDSFGDPANLLANATSLLDALDAAGAPEKWGIIPSRPGASWNATYASAGRRYETAIGPLTKLYRTRGVQPIYLDGVAWNAEGLSSDLLHPAGLAGQNKYAQITIEGMIA